MEQGFVFVWKPEAVGCLVRLRERYIVVSFTLDLVILGERARAGVVSGGITGMGGRIVVESAPLNRFCFRWVVGSCCDKFGGVKTS